MTSTMHSFPTQRHSPPPSSSSCGATAVLERWSQLQTLRKLSSELLRANRASPTVATTESDLRAGLPRQRSLTLWLNNPAAMQIRSLLGGGGGGGGGVGGGGGGGGGGDGGGGER